MIISPQFITDFGDSAVTGMIAALLAVTFFFTNNKRAALAMILAYGLSGALIAAAKIAFYSCWLASSSGLHSPSGHTAVSTAVYGTLVLIAASPLKIRYRVPAYFLMAAFVIAIGISRVILGSHSIPEVLCGFVGGAAVCGFVWYFCLRGKPVVINYLALISITLFTVIIIHGVRLPAEILINNIAAFFGQLGHGC